MCTMDGFLESSLQKQPSMRRRDSFSRGLDSVEPQGHASNKIRNMDMRTLGAGFVDHGCDRTRSSESVWSDCVSTTRPTGGMMKQVS